MKKEYALSILSLIILLLGFTACTIALFLTNLSTSSRSILILFGICFIAIGITSYAVHSTKYVKMSYLKNNDLPILAHWHYKENSSVIINDVINERKTSAIFTTMLTLLLLLVISLIIYLTKEKYSVFISLACMLISLIISTVIFSYLPYYYNTQLYTPAEALIGEDSILFLDELFSLQHSIYFLEDVRIHYEDENTLQFLYGAYDLFTEPAYTLSIPIPDGELELAKRIQTHYIDLITWTPSDS